MTDANLNPDESNPDIQKESDIKSNGHAVSPTWEIDGRTLPLFPFDQPCEITLRNGTIHRFKLWDEKIEKQRETILKSIVTTSPAVVNGENPRQVQTDFTRSVIRYYDLMIDQIGGVALNPGDDPNSFYDANAMLPGQSVKVLDLIGAPIKKSAGIRLYSGKIEILRPKADNDEPEFDPLSPGDDLDIEAEMAKSEKARTVYQLSAERIIPVRQELGSELQKNGRMTPASHIIDYHFREPDAEDYSRWEMKGSAGPTINLSGGGTRAERRYNLDTMKILFNKLITRIDGASLAGQSIVLSDDLHDERRQALLAQVPLLIKKLTVATLFQEVENLGND